MILIDPIRVVTVTMIVGFIFFVMGLLISRRLGYVEGLATWRKR